MINGDINVQDVTNVSSQKEWYMSTLLCTLGDHRLVFMCSPQQKILEYLNW